MNFYWIAQYNDGSEICSKDGAKYNDINRACLKKFALLKLDNNEVVVTFMLGSARRLIVRMRTRIRTFDGKRETIWIAGWQQTVNDINTQVIAFVFPDGSVELTDGFRKDEALYNPVVFRPEEA